MNGPGTQDIITDLETIATDITDIDTKLGEKTNTSFDNTIPPSHPSIFGHLKANYYHVHAPAYLYPAFLDAISLSNDDSGSPAGAWTEGDKTVLIASGAIPYPFDIHFVKVFSTSDVDEYTITLYANDILIGQIGFARSNNFTRQNDCYIQIPPQAAGTEIKGTLAAQGGAVARSVTLKFYIHAYSDIV